MAASTEHGDGAKLGLMVPLSGLADMYGADITWAAHIARDEINRNGGVLGRPLELVVVDDGSRTDTAVSVAESLIDNFGCVALVGNILSNARIAVVQMVAEPHHVPYLSFGFNEGSLSSRYVFGFGALPNQQIEPALPYAIETLGPKFYFAASNHEWPRGVIASVIDRLTSIGGEVVGETYMDDMSSTRTMLDQLARSGTDVFVPLFVGSKQIDLLNQFHRNGLSGRMNVLTGHANEALVRHLDPEVRDGLYACSTYFMPIETPSNRNYLDRLRRLSEVRGLAPLGNGLLTNFGEGVYICLHAFAQAANAAGTLDREALMRALLDIRMEAPQGRVTMDPATRNAVLNSFLGRCRPDGRFRIVRAFGPIRPVIPDRYGSANDSPSAERPPASRDFGEPIGSSSVDAVAVIEPDRTLGYANQAFRGLWADGAVAIGQPVRDLWADPTGFEQLLGDIARTTAEWRGTRRGRNPDGSMFELTFTVDPIPFGAPEGGRVMLICPTGTSSDPIAARIDRILGVADIAVIATDSDGCILHANIGAAELFGYDAGTLRGLSVNMLVPPNVRGRHADLMRDFAAGDCYARQMSQRREIVGYRQNGTTFPAEASISKFFADDQWILVVTLRDIADRKRLEESLMRRATHDSLTGLPNRDLFRERLFNALARSERSGLPVTLTLIDIDRFKLINDTAGQQVGDRLLSGIANRLMGIVGSGDTVGHLGADEFIVMREQVSDLATVAALAGRIVETLREPFSIDTFKIASPASVGFAQGYGGRLSADDLIRNASTAMQDAKAHGGDGWRFFSEDLEEAARRQLMIVDGLRGALDRQELDLVYQPIVDSRNGAIVGAESLLRWTPDFGSVPPDQFVPIAESIGAIVHIGRWVFAETCHAEARLRAALGADAPYLTVNVSMRQLTHETLVADFEAALRDAGADPRRLVLELTETSLTNDSETDLRVLDKLCDLGLRVAIDDFGTGYSSLLQLLRLPISTIKIDRAFVDSMDSNRDSRLITRAISKMAKELGKDLVAEGVENATQLAQLQGIGCTLLQGYHFYRPMPESELIEVVRERPERGRVRHVADRYVIYVSRATQPMTQDDLHAILEASRAYNARNDVTGFLVYGNGRFMQMLEGPEEAIQELMNRIALDTRHADVRMVLSGHTRQRLFREWSMGFWDMRGMGDGFPGYDAWRQDTMDLLEWAEDARVCFALFEALSIQNQSPDDPVEFMRSEPKS